MSAYDSTREEDALEQAVDLVLDAAQLLARLDALDPELAEQLARAVVRRRRRSRRSRSHCRRTVKIGWIAEKTRRPSRWKKFLRLSKMNGASGVCVSTIVTSW